jgi:aminopeptidase N
MLRRLLGDEAFFKGLRVFYHRSRFTKVGTDDVRQAFEEASGRSLEVFFDQWIRGADLPSLSFDWRAQGQQVRLRFEQRGALFELPVTVTLSYRSGETENVVVPVVDRVTELTVPLKGPLRSVKANDDYAALARIR